jgi:hypothetical protein
MWTFALAENILRDIRFTARILLKNLSFSIIAVLTLALGVGANTAMFSLLDQVVLRLLPISRPRAACHRQRDRKPLRQQLRPQHHFLADV